MPVKHKYFSDNMLCFLDYTSRPIGELIQHVLMRVCYRLSSDTPEAKQLSLLLSDEYHVLSHIE